MTSVTGYFTLNGVLTGNICPINAQPFAIQPLRLDQQQCRYFASFTGQDVVSATRGSRVHGFNPYASADQVL
jgi:hypothetical protein